MKKRLFSILLSLAMVVTMMPAMTSISFAGEANATVPVELVKATTSGSRAVKLSWNKVDTATKYVVYGNKCGKSFKKLATVKSNKYTVKKINGKKLEAHKNYKFYVVAYSGSKKLVTSKSIHFITGRTSGKYANAKSITVNPTSVTLEPGKTATLKATTKIYNNKKHIKMSHGAATRYVSDNPTVASVDANGVVTAKNEGTATIYVQDIGGLWCKTVVTVKLTRFNVSFDANGHGTAPSTITVVKGQKATKPANPTAVGYTFGGWYKEAACTNAWNFDTDTVTADTTLYAKWTQNPTPPAPATTYTVTFNLNGIEGTEPSAQKVAKDGKVPKPTDPTNLVHTFAGWYKTKDATTGALSDLWDFDNGTVTADMTLYAQWTRTLESIYTNSDIPKATNNTAPDNAWVNGDGGKAFIAYSTGNTVLYLYKQLQPSGAKQLSCSKTENFTKIDDDYVLDYYIGNTFYGKYTLHMTEGNFTSVTYDGTNTDWEVLSGTYSAPATKTVADIIPGEFPEE